MTDTGPAREQIARCADLLETEADAPAFMVFRRAETIGRPLAGEAFTRQLETRLGRSLLPQKRGPKPKTQKDVLPLQVIREKEKE